ncbi:MAG: VirB4 family type IV secretion/conjugal transfer ATPase [Litorimonas sp.]
MPTKLANRRLMAGKKIRAEMSQGRHIPYTRMVDHSTVKLRDGAMMRVLAIEGWPFETTDDDQIDALKALKNVIYRGISSPTTAIYTHIIRRKTDTALPGEMPDEFSRELGRKYKSLLQARTLYENALYLTIVERPDFLTKSQQKFSKKSKPRDLSKLTPKARERVKAVAAEKQTEAARIDAQSLRILDEKSSLLEQNLSQYGVRLLGKNTSPGGLLSEPLAFIYELVNGVQRPVALPSQEISDYIPSTRLVFGRESLHYRGAHKAQERFSSIISIKDYAPETMAGMLDELLSLPFAYVLTQSFAFEGRQKSVDRLDTTRRKYASADDSITLQQQLLDAKDQVQAGAVAFGRHHLTLQVLSDNPKDLDTNVSKAITTFTNTGCITVREDVNLEAAFWAQLPGNFSYIARGAGISSLNFASFSSLHNYPYGKETGNHWGDCVTTFETVAGTPFHFNFHVNDLGNFTCIGPSGSGKTVLLGFLMSQAQKFSPKCIFFDKDRGAEILIRALGGSYGLIEPGVPTGFNPLQLPNTEENRAFLLDWIKSLIGRKTTSDEDKILTTAIGENFKQSKSAQNLHIFSELVLGQSRDEQLGQDLAKWHSDGEYAWLFDNEEDTLDLDSRVIAFDLTSILDTPLIRTPTLLYMFHRVRMALDGTKSLIFIDEGWKALDDPVFANKIKDWLKTIRKMNGVIGFGSQSASDAANSSISDSLIEQCPTQIFMPNSKAKEDDYRGAFALTEAEFRVVKESPVGSRQFLIKQGNGSAVAKLDLAGMDDEIAVLSGRTETVNLLRDIREEVGDDPDVWLPIFHKRRQE